MRLLLMLLLLLAVHGDFARKGKDLSGIACAPGPYPRSGLVIDDETQFAQRVTVAENGDLTPGETIPLNHETFQGKPMELDGEAVAYADDCYYVVGSHGHPRYKRDPQEVEVAVKACSQIFRIESHGKVTGSSALRALLLAQPDLKPHADHILQDNGLTVEGLAAWKGKLYVGFRGPVVNGKAFVLSVSPAALFSGGASDAELHKLDVGGGIRDLAPVGDGLLVLVDRVIWKWDGKGCSKLVELPERKGNPEALLPLDGERVLVLSDGAKNGDPMVAKIRK